MPPSGSEICGGIERGVDSRWSDIRARRLVAWHPGRVDRDRVSRVTPSASRLTKSLRSVGYDPSTAIADLIDNSVSAGADQIDIQFRFETDGSYILIADNGHGMTPRMLKEAMRFGTVRDYGNRDLGRFGLGMKTAALSMGRRLTVVTNHSVNTPRIYSWVLDLDHIDRTDRWEILSGKHCRAKSIAKTFLSTGPGTVLVIDKLDRLLPGRSARNGHGRRRLENVERHVREYLSMVFHRFLEHAEPLRILLGTEKVSPWNPFAPDEEATLEIDPRRIDVEHGGTTTGVAVRRFVLPNQEDFSSRHEFDRLSGPSNWNRQQGLYIYRSDRMIQSGGWCGLRGIDEHLKLARLSLDFDAGLDDLFEIDIAKMRVTIPDQIRNALKDNVDELCRIADVTYRGRARSDGPGNTVQVPEPGLSDLNRISRALTLAANRTGTWDELVRIRSRVRTDDPQLADALGW